MPQPRGVLFDIGYTLLDETDRLHAALEWVGHRMGKGGQPADLDTLHARYVAACENPDPDEPSLLVQTLRSLNVPTDEARRWRKELKWDAVPMTAFPDAHEALTALRDAGLRLGVLANQPASAKDDLERLGLAGFFDGIYLSDAVGLAKPDPAFFRLVLSMWRMAPEHVAYVGDRPDNDVAPARALGLHTLRVRLGPHAMQQPRDAAQVPHMTADSLAQAAARLITWAT